MISYFIAFLWGFAEATFFFFLPDIYLSRLSIHSPKKAFIACFVAAFAAILGGSLMYLWGFYDLHSAYTFLTYIPVIFPKLIRMVFKTLSSNPFEALLLAPLKGIPYKIYAVAFGARHISFFYFIIVSFFARLIRFISITTLTGCIVFFLKKYVSVAKLYRIHLLSWFLIYIIYFISEVVWFF